MTAICLTIERSKEEVSAGIPRTVCITTNIPSSIFYTLDNSIPTVFSNIYVSPIFLPTDQLTVVLKVFATNGSVSSPVLTECYFTNIVDGNARLPHSGTDARSSGVMPDTYPFGTPPYHPGKFISPGDVGVNVYNQGNPRAVPNAVNADGYKTSFSNKPYNTENYQIVYTTRNAEGQYGLENNDQPGITIGEYPSDIYPDPAQIGNQGPEETQQWTATFDPRALVIYQDFANEDPNDPPVINRQFMTLENPDRARDGIMYSTSYADGGATPISGSFIRSGYNPRTGELTSYFRDSWSNRWIIATTPYQGRAGGYDGNLSLIVPGLSRFVFEWVPYTHRVLF